MCTDRGMTKEGIIVDKFNKVVTYEFGTALVAEMLGMMDVLGCESHIISGGTSKV